MKEILNAKITNTFLGIEDHGIMTYHLQIQTNPFVYFVGNYDIRRGNCGAESIQKILETVEVRSWEELKGKLIRIEIEDAHITKIGNILEDKWFNLAEYFHYKAEEYKIKK